VAPAGQARRGGCGSYATHTATALNSSEAKDWPAHLSPTDLLQPLGGDRVLDVLGVAEDTDFYQLLALPFLDFEKADALGVLLLPLGGDGLPLGLGHLLGCHGLSLQGNGPGMVKAAPAF